MALTSLHLFWMTYLCEIVMLFLLKEQVTILLLIKTYSLQFHLQQKALDAAMNDINNSFGKGSVTRLGSAGGAFVYVSDCSIPSIKFSL